MGASIRAAAFAVLAAAGLAGAGGAAQAAEDPAYVSVATGWYDWNRQKDQGAEFRLEYRSDYQLWIFKPFAALAGTSTGSFWGGAGVLVDVYLGDRIVATPSFAPGYYNQGGASLDLGYPLEFRSQLEIAYRFDDRSRLGLAISHYSNASLGDKNPGTESAMVYYSVPIGKLFGN